MRSSRFLRSRLGSLRQRQWAKPVCQLQWRARRTGCRKLGPPPTDGDGCRCPDRPPRKDKWCLLRHGPICPLPHKAEPLRYWCLLESSDGGCILRNTIAKVTNCRFHLCQCEPHGNQLIVQNRCLSRSWIVFVDWCRQQPSWGFPFRQEAFPCPCISGPKWCGITQRFMG